MFTQRSIHSRKRRATAFGFGISGRSAAAWRPTHNRQPLHTPLETPRRGRCEQAMLAALLAATHATSAADLVQAAERGEQQGLEEALLAGVHVDATDEKGYTALHAAARNGHAGAIQRLVSAGANPDIRFKKAWSALAFAADYANDNDNGMESVVALLNAGANPLLEDLNSYTAMMRADAGTPHRALIMEAAYKRKSREGTWAGWEAEDEAHQ